MSLILFRFWPALLPLIIYIIWHRLAVKRALKEGTPPPHFRDKPLYWAVISSLCVAALCFVFMGLTHEAVQGNYVPPMVKDGKIIPGHVE